jgi:hypothetical protein
MNRSLALALVALAFMVVPASAAGLSGSYVEARTCDVWTGPCFANAEVNMGGKNAVLGWKIDKGELDGVALDGLGVVAVVAASDTLGQVQTGPARAVLIVDSRANKTQHAALVRLARKQGGDLVKNVIRVESAAVDLEICPCKNDACAILKAGTASLRTRCLNGDHDKICGNESAFYPPLASGVEARAALAVDNTYTGNALNETWKETGRRSAYVGSFKLR